jgi:NAD(P)-dependent dehydrogenase (short-subunit alcohol dehydrogenase family)
MDFKRYAAEADDAVLLAPMIETRRGMDNAAAIAAVPGVDLVFIGTGDLALSIGTFPEFGPAHEAAVKAIAAACRQAGTPCGIFTPHATFAADRRRQGFSLVVVAEDIGMVHGAAKAGVRRFAPGRPFDIAGSTALVTGTGRGIGPAIVEALLAAGAARIWCGVRRPGAAAALLARAPDRLFEIVLDVTREADVAAAARRCADTTLLVNNAGINFNTGLMVGETTANARAEIETNYLGTLAMVRAFAPVLARGGGGAIVNLISILAHMNLPQMASLCASKAALLSATQAMRAELAAQGTRVMAVLPGAVDTDMTRDFEGAKMAPVEVAAALVHGLSVGAEEVYPGEMAAGVAMGLAVDAKAVERQFAAYLPKARPRAAE